jgi:hypothetical protein
MDFQIVNPNEHPDWDDLLLSSNDHSFFHTAAWSKVLESTYRFKPLYFTCFEGNRLSFLMPLMEVRSRLTGRRGVSLPFTDHCVPLAPQAQVLDAAVREAIERGEKAKWKYLEWRDGRYFAEGVPAREEFYAHDIDLGKAETALFANLYDNNRRNIKKATREGVSVKIERSADSVREFYGLNCLTRKRHGLPPQPYSFFKNVHELIIRPGHGIVVSASFEGQAVAASIFFHFGTAALYKYGASNLEHQHLRANNLVMWEAMKWYRNQGVQTLSLGRTEMENPGLLQYKRTWGAKECVIRYFRYDVARKVFLEKHSGGEGLHNKIFSRTPAPALRLIGRALYKHIG